MGLDSVELVMAWEEEFGIDIRDGEAAETETVGQAVDLVLRKLREEAERKPAADFVKEALLGVAGVERESLGDSTRLEQCFPPSGRMTDWERLRESLGAHTVPNLERPPWLKGLGWIVVGGVAAVFWPHPMSMLAAFLAAGLVWLWLTQPLVRAIPRDVETVGALVRRCEARRARFRENRSLTREQVREKVVDIIVEQLGVKPEDCREEARFIADLGCD